MNEHAQRKIIWQRRREI